MDFVTHALAAAGAGRLIAPRREQIPQLTLSALLGGLLMDFDSWLALGGLSAYGRYHRTVSHTVWALAALALLSALLGWLAAARPGWRRFGWFASDTLDRAAQPPPRAGAGWFLAVAGAAAALHWVGDWITGFGNLEPFWPWSAWDPSLRAVKSFDVAIFSATLAWHVTLRAGRFTRRGEAWLGLGWLAAVALYVAARMVFCEPTIV